MQAHGRLRLIVAALIGGASVHLVLEACSRSGLSGDAMHDMARAESPPITPSPFLSDWQSYQPAVTGKDSGAVIANQVTTGKWRRVGDTLELRITTKLSGLPTGSCTDYWVWGLPPGAAIDLPKYDGIAGAGNASGSGNRNAKLHTIPSGTAGIAAIADVDCPVNPTVPFALGEGGVIALNAAVPIAGWSATY